MPSAAVDSSTVCLTLDLDWAPDHVLEDTRLLLQQVGLPATIFATHQSPGVTALLALPGCETGVHPNFLGDPDEDAVLTRVLTAFPTVVGVRCHELYFDSRLLPLFQRKGVRYFSNDLMFLHSGLQPYYDWSGLVRLPLYWEDDVHCLYFDGRFDCAALHLEQPGLKILNFHPVHLYLNTREIADYQAAKSSLADPAASRKLRREGPGIRSLFLDVVAGLQGSQMRTLGALAEKFRVAHAFEGRTAERFAQQARKERAL
jgi:hypothetical protein